MDAAAIGTAIVGALTSALSMVGTVAQNVVSGFSALFFTGTGENQTLSSFAIVMLVFGGVALAVGIGRLVLKLVQSKTGR